MDQTEREQLAQRLSALTFKDARKEIRCLDPDADMAFFRNAIWGEYHTLFLLPNAGLQITLVEKATFDMLDRRDHSGPPDRKIEKPHFSYVEARVEDLKRPLKAGRRHKIPAAEQ